MESILYDSPVNYLWWQSNSLLAPSYTSRETLYSRAVRFLSKVMEHKSSTVAFKEYKLMLRLSSKLLSKYDDVMLLADRGFANHQLVSWLKTSPWHYCLRLPCDVTIHGARRYPIELKYLALLVK